MTVGLGYFLVIDNLLEVVETSQSTSTGAYPQVIPISGTVTFTSNYSEIDSAALDATVMLDPVIGRFSVTMNSGTYTWQAGDTWASAATNIGGQCVTAATLQAANPGVTTPVTNQKINTPSGNDGALRSINGARGVELVDNVNLGLSQGKLVYRVDFSNVVFDDLSNRPMAAFKFAAPGDGSTIDLNTVDRLPLMP